MNWNTNNLFRGGFRFFPHVIPIAFPLIFPLGLGLAFGLFHIFSHLIGPIIIGALIFFIIRAFMKRNGSMGWNPMSNMGQRWQQPYQQQAPYQQQTPYYQPSTPAGQEQPAQPSEYRAQPEQPYYQPTQAQEPYYRPTQAQQQPEQMPPMQQ
jgi:predicted lipid-binding transport protein (Tim44 family)